MCDLGIDWSNIWEAIKINEWRTATIKLYAYTTWLILDSKRNLWGDDDSYTTFSTWNSNLAHVSGVGAKGASTQPSNALFLGNAKHVEDAKMRKLRIIIYIVSEKKRMIQSIHSLLGTCVNVCIFKSSKVSEHTRKKWTTLGGFGGMISSTEYTHIQRITCH